MKQTVIKQKMVLCEVCGSAIDLNYYNMHLQVHGIIETKKETLLRLRREGKIPKEWKYEAQRNY